MSRDVRRVIVLGSTGSIGVQTLEVIEHLNALNARGGFPFRHAVVGLAGGSDSGALIAQRERHPDAVLACARGDAAACRHRGPAAALELVRAAECDLVVSAIAGCAGLPATLEAVRLGRDIALANKETLVAAGSLVVDTARRSGARLLPVDSEHAGLWACLGGEAAPPMDASRVLRRAVITASGGPFRDRTAAECHDATPEQALRHPNWTMGRKVTIDSATMMNKALELLEAHWLFGLRADQLAVLIHPQSIAHALVERADGSVLAHLAPPDMRGPIQQALAFPACVPGRAPLDWAALRSLEFREPDPARFPAIALASRVIQVGGTAGAIMNAANEEAVAAFLARRLPFGRVVEVVRAVMESVPASRLGSLDDALGAEERARAAAREVIARD